MGGPLAPERPSLERLKTLDSLPDLQTQLDEARQLCNHTARADMILKWLLEKIKSTAEVRTTARAWDLLAMTFRLLPLERLATLLGSFNLLESVQLALHDKKDAESDRELLLAISDAFKLLLELASSAKGAPLQAYLSVDAATAAAFVATWMSSVYEIASASDGSADLVTQDALLEPAVRIWNLRRRSVDENEEFAKHCLVPAAQLTSALSRSDATSGSGKRKRGGDDRALTYTRSLESLLAKHVFLPARTAFFGAQEGQRSSKRQSNGIHSPALDERLAALKATEGGVGFGLAVGHLQDILLDIALRCSPSAMTPRQRLKESSWIEAIFTALLDTNQTADLMAYHEMIRGTLVVVRTRNSLLSTDYLAKLITAHAKYGEAPHYRVDWALIAEVVKLDPKVFVNPETASALFDDVSEAELANAQSDTLAATMSEKEREDLHVLCRDGIVVPIMVAFARNRDLNGFVELWYEQLLRTWPEDVIPVWAELDKAFAPLVEESLPTAQITTLVRRHRTWLGAYSARTESSTASPEEALSNVHASVTILNALSAGIRSPELLDSLWEEVNNVFTALVDFYGFGSTEERQLHQAYSPLWALLTRCLELWYPLWAVRETDRALIAEQTEKILSSALLTRAEAVSRGQDRAKTAKKATSEARMFLATLSSLLHTESVHRELELGDRLAEQVEDEEPYPLLVYPNLLGNLEGTTVRKSALIGWFEAALPAVDGGKVSPAALVSICAVVATAVTSGQAAVIEDIVRVTLTYLEPGDIEDSTHDAARAELGLRVFAEFPASALTTAQRGRILDAVAALEHLRNMGERIFQERLVVMIRMLELPCPNAKLLTDSAVLWQLANPEHERENIGLGSQPPVAGSKTQGLLQQLVGIVMKHLLATQAQDQPRAMLITLYAEAMQYIQSLTLVREVTEYPRLLAVIKTLLAHTKSLRNDLAGQCMDDAILQTYGEGMLPRAMKLDFAEQLRDDHSWQQALATILDAVLHLPATIIEGKVISEALRDFVVRFVSAGDLTNMLAGEGAPMSDGLNQVLVRCVQALSRIGFQPEKQGPVLIAQLAASLLERDLQPHSYAEVCDAFRKACINANSLSRFHMLQQLLAQQGSVPALRLLRITISTLNREDFGEETAFEFSTSQVIFDRVLRISKKAQDFAIKRAACDCIITILKEKPFMTNQYTIEATVATLKHLAQPGRHMSIMYLDICRITTVLLQQHRSRLKDRMNIVVDLLQSLISCLFSKSKPLPTKSRALTARHAKVFARILQLLCDPPPQRSRAKVLDLVDEARKAQARVGQYVQFVLHHYCTQVLHGTLAEGVREALMPGLWAMIEAMEVNDTDSVKCLSAAMDNSERAVLRGVYEEYKSFGKWKGG